MANRVNVVTIMLLLLPAKGEAAAGAGVGNVAAVPSRAGPPVDDRVVLLLQLLVFMILIVLS